MVEYRGYGYFSDVQVGSCGFQKFKIKIFLKPEIIKMMEDTTRIQRTLERTFSIKNENVVVMGRSLGSIFASEYCKRYPNICLFPTIMIVAFFFVNFYLTAGLIIESGFNNASSFYFDCMKKKIKKEMGEDLLMKLKECSERTLDNGGKIADFTGPVLIFHAEDDPIVPYSNAEGLFSCCTSNKKEFCSFKTGRHNVCIFNCDEYFEKFHCFLDKIFTD